MTWGSIERSLISLLWGACATGIGWELTRIAQRITYVRLADGRLQARPLPLLMRLHLPLAPNLAPLFRRPAFENSRKRLDRRIVAAGYEGALKSEDILCLRVLIALVTGGLWVLFVTLSARSAPDSVIDKSSTILMVVGLVWLFLYPDLWLKRTLQARHRVIQRALPFVLDLLTLSVEAGLDFMTALQRGVQRRPVDALGEELIRVIREIQIGKTRSQSLKDFAYRVDLADVRSVVNALVQADELGVSIGSILRIQADQMRQRRFERAEKLANEAPVKMLFPLMVFIFPAVFLILLGPIINRLLQEGL
jgi:tight adherence protein C